MKAAAPRRKRVFSRRGDATPRTVHGAVPRDRVVSFFAFVAAVTLAATAITVPALIGLPGLARDASASFWVIAGIAVIADLWSFATPGRRTPTIHPSLAFSAALLVGWGLGAAIAAQALAVLIFSLRVRQAPWRVVLTIGRYTLAFGAAWLVLRGTGTPPLAGRSLDHLSGSSTLAPLLSYIGAAAAWVVTNQTLATAATWLRFRGDLRATVTRTLRQDLFTTLALTALAPVIVAVGNVSAALVPLLLMPFAAVKDLARFSNLEHVTSMRDELTGLPNRKALYLAMRSRERSFAARLRRRPDDQRRMALLLLDIDHFRRVNDALGHAVGDRLLGAVANRLTETIGADGLVARLGGDEFAIFAPRLRDSAAATVLAERVAAALAEPVTLEGLPLDVTAAIGVAIHPDHGTDATALLRHAEAAMYDAKDRGAAYAIYTQESDQNNPERLELVAELRRSLDNGRPDEIQLYYQPQVDIATGAVVGVEALLRWRHPRRGMVSPEHLIRVAERTAVMRLLTARVLDDAVSQLAKWKTQGLNLRISVNVSVRDLHRPDFVDHLEQLLAERGVPPNLIQLEITEGALMADPRRVLVTLHRLDKLGVALSLDDFGTGYSSLQHLRRLPLAEVKIDRSFVMGMQNDPDDAAVVGSIIDLARALGLRVVAEGVEDDTTRRMLLAGGCEVAQGWYYARPMPADELVAWLARYRLAQPRSPDRG